MAILVLRETTGTVSDDLGPGDAVPETVKVHAAPTGPDASEDPDDRTFCGMPTLDMERLDCQPPGPGAPWLPPDMRPWECTGCADALRTP
ncbi:hypothetical protein [Streptomyces apricus]|uniref:Uncharacterized protein n=1 Tax=Streptomyces apricus TaxID=1828112 RepID=A0A5B0BKI3_9ACTN|nr:hypothetical protein [Streptomyces apricus]KAA0941961.1 hypothetical protein FGF04_04115 [Streptomyces apricus]